MLRQGSSVDARTNAEPFGVFYERYFASVLAFFRRRVPGPEEAFDLTAETFAAALSSVPRFQPGPEPPQAWLFAIARHKLSEALRSSRIQDEARRALAMQPIHWTTKRSRSSRRRQALRRSSSSRPWLPSSAKRSGPPRRRARLHGDRDRASLLGERHPQARQSWPGCDASPTSKWRVLMSDPISDLKHELLAAAVRQQSHAATGRERTRAHSRRRWVIVAVAGLVLVGGLLATPALGIGDRLLGLIEGKRSAQPGDVQAPAWSRDGRTIVFVSWRDGNGEVYAMDADGSGPRNLTQHPAKDFRPAWSPNGRRIAFVSRRDGNAEIYVMNADGSGKRNLTRDRASDDDYPTWSHDGRKLAFLRVRVHSRRAAVCRERRRQWAAQADGSPPGDASAGLVTGRADDLLRALPRQHRRERIADAPVRTVDSRLVARRAADRLHEPQGPDGACSALRRANGYLRHERRRERNPQADAQRRL